MNKTTLFGPPRMAPHRSGYLAPYKPLETREEITCFWHSGTSGLAPTQNLLQTTTRTALQVRSQHTLNIKNQGDFL
jgi:hypothetical protein